MGFLSGRVTFMRYRVGGDSALPFGDDILELARQHLIGQHGAEAADGISTGWAGGDHVLDLTIDPGKNVINDALHMAIRIDADKIPGSLLRAYTQMEIDARAKLNPSGFATKAQKRGGQGGRQGPRRRPRPPTAGSAATTTTRSSGTVRPRPSTPARPAPASSSGSRRCSARPSTARSSRSPSGNLARSLTLDGPDDPGSRVGHPQRQPDRRRRRVPAGEAPSVAWTGDDPTSLDYLGNEFLLWIWHALQNDGESVKLSDGSEATVMLAKTLTLDCPRGETGRDQLTDDAPTRLPEAFRALQAGKLPRKAGMILVRHGAQYELTLQAETLAVSGAAPAQARRRRPLPPRPEDRPHR